MFIKKNCNAGKIVMQELISTHTVSCLFENLSSCKLLLVYLPSAYGEAN